MKQPDRCARVVEKVQRKDDWGINCVSSDEVIKLLRAEHRAVVRVVSAPCSTANSPILDMPIAAATSWRERLSFSLTSRT